MIPSSKIETRDLSPQVLSGVAQESTSQEILEKINASSDPDILLNTQIIFNDPDITSYEDKSIFKIEGRGKLYWAECRGYLNGNNSTTSFPTGTYMDFKILIDGECVFWQRCEKTSGTNFEHRWLVISPEKAIFNTESYAKAYAPHGEYTYLNRLEYIGASYGGEMHIGNKLANGEISFIEKYLRFKNSLEILVSNHNGNGYTFDDTSSFNIGYSLDEE